MTTLPQIFSLQALQVLIRFLLRVLQRDVNKNPLYIINGQHRQKPTFGVCQKFTSQKEAVIVAEGDLIELNY